MEAFETSMKLVEASTEEVVEAALINTQSTLLSYVRKVTRVCGTGYPPGSPD